MDKWTFFELAKRILIEEKRPLSTEEIWETAKIKGYDKNVGSEGKTPWNTIGVQIYKDIREYDENSTFVKVGSRPRTFYLRSQLKDVDIIKIEERQTLVTEAKEFKYEERDLHPFLAYHGYYFMNNVYTKTIAHTKSKKEGYGEWLHPDMVGCHFPLNDWTPEVVEFSSKIGGISVELSSFEIKRELNFSNLREAFFQAVSNSSWANEGYLVAAGISNEESFQAALGRLSKSFGIGVIRLNITDPDSPALLFPAAKREYLDWDTIDELAERNPDFTEFLKRVMTDISSKEIRGEKYDKILSKEDLLKSIKSHALD